jgi:hypothetical protein
LHCSPNPINKIDLSFKVGVCVIYENGFVFYENGFVFYENGFVFYLHCDRRVSFRRSALTNKLIKLIKLGQFLKGFTVDGFEIDSVPQNSFYVSLWEECLSPECQALFSPKFVTNRVLHLHCSRCGQRSN